MKRFLFISLIILFATGYISAQTKTQKTYYDAAKKQPAGIVNVLAHDTTIKHGDYKQFAQDGTLITCGQYMNGKKTGHWVTFSKDGNVLTSGAYDQNENLSGVKISYDNTGKFSGIEYYKKGLTIKPGIQAQMQMTDSLNSLLSAMNCGSDSGLLKKIKGFVIQSAGYKALTDDVPKLQKGDILICNMVNFYETVVEYSALKKSVEVISAKINSRYHGDLLKAYKSRLQPVEKQITDFGKTDSLALKIRIANKVIAGFSAIEKDIDDLITVSSSFSSKYPLVENHFKTTYPAIYNRQFTRLKKQAELFNSNDSLELKLIGGKKLLIRLDTLESWYSQFDMFDSYLLVKEPDIKLQLSQTYPSLTKNYLDPFEKSVADYRNMDSAELKLSSGQLLIKNLDYLEKSLTELVNNDRVTNGLFPLVRDEYLKTYPSIFKNEIKPLETEISNNKADTILKRRVENTVALNIKLKSLKSGFTDLSRVDSTLDVDLPAIKARYNSKYPDIYKAEFIPFETQKNEYENLGIVETRLTAGKKLLERLGGFNRDFNLLQKQKNQIDSLFPPLKIRYKEAYSDIYKSRIKEIEGQIGIYNNATKLSARLKSGEDILNDIRSMAEGFDALKVQESEIQQKLQQAENGYSAAFPVIDKTEIKDIKGKFKEYSRLETVEKKVSQGKIIIDRLDLVNNSLQELKELDASISTLLPQIQTKYKKSYSPVYKAEIVPVLESFKEYSDNGFVTTKMNSGKKILTKLKYFDTKFTNLTDLDSRIKGKYTEFNDLYKSRKEIRNIYKKGKMAYSELFSAYENESSIEKKILMGEDVELVLLKLVSISNKDNAVLNNDIKTAETAADVKRKLGL